VGLVHGPAVLGWLLTALCGGGAYCLARVREGGSAVHRQASGLEGLMGLGMAAMAVPATAVPSAPAPAFVAVFTASAVWSLTLLRAGAAHQTHHLLESLAMVHMAVAMSGQHGHAGHGGAGHPVLTALLLAYFGGYVLRTGHRLLSAGRHPGAGPRPEVAAASRLTLAMGMFTMLLML
jgi:hypothetical protein